ncbi:hypothetical protein FRB99_006122 [Tulasnella sp. 403]|nr:hypothetical protein FRB99_006122 [Tulasnella sp. 403]
MAEKKPGNNASGSDMTSATWSYILPSLDYIMRDPIPTQDNRAPTLTVAQHANIYTVVYNFATASRMGLAGVPGFGLTGATGMREGFDAEREASMDKFERVRAMIGYELYSLLDDYFRDLAREIRMNAPLPPPTPSPTLTSNPRGRSSTQSKAKARAATSSDPSEPLGDELALLRYYMNAYTRFSSGAAQINRLFAYLNRHFVMRAIDEGCGWISLSDVIAASVLKGIVQAFFSNTTAPNISIDLASMSISASHKPPKREKPVTNGASASSKKTKEGIGVCSYVPACC